MIGVRPSLIALLLAVLVNGCCHPLHRDAMRLIKEMDTHSTGLAGPLPIDATPPGPETAPLPAATVPAGQGLLPAVPAPVQPTVLRQVAGTEAQPAAEKPPPRTIAERLPIPPELTGRPVPPLSLPRDPKERAAAIQKLFPPLPPLGPDPGPLPVPEAAPLTLVQLQQLASENSPVLREAGAAVEAARGAAVQAGLYPNPTVGYIGDSINQGLTAGMQGGFIEQLLKTAGKLKLAKAAALIELGNAEVALRRTQVDLATQVRAGYFAVLVARENLKVSVALARLADEVYQIHVEQVKAAQAAPYEPMQMRVLAMQARSALVQARNRYISAWKQLAANLGLPNLPPTEIIGQVHGPIPLFRYDLVLDRMLEQHTDVLTVENNILRDRFQLRLAQVTPIPDVGVGVEVTKDYTTPPFHTVATARVGVPMPLFDRNQGNIHQAEANLMRSTAALTRVRNDLTRQLAEAFERYENARVILDYYQTMILPDQVRAFRGAYERHQQEPDRVGFVDVVNAQQTLAGTITAYVDLLGALWDAVVDVANLLQTSDLYLEAGECVVPLAGIEELK